MLTVPAGLSRTRTVYETSDNVRLGSVACARITTVIMRDMGWDMEEPMHLAMDSWPGWMCHRSCADCDEDAVGRRDLYDHVIELARAARSARTG